MDRRRFVRLAAAAPPGLMALGSSARRAAGAQSFQERFPVVASEPWGRLLRVADGVWALASEPLRDRTTLCNGGIVQGRAGVLLVEAFGSDEGSRWMVEQARTLTGRLPTHVILTHHHADHTRGLRAAAAATDVALATSETRDRVFEREPELAEATGSRVEVLDDRRPTEIDLGDRSLVVVPRRGHTRSDVTVEVFDASVAFCGDLVWNGMFPNYVDAAPLRLSQAVRVLRARGMGTYVSGHGTMADPEAVDRYIALLDDVEAVARRALERGETAEAAGARYRLPAGMEDWVLFDPGYLVRAIGAWMRELG